MNSKPIQLKEGRDEIFSDPKAIANKFNTYFSSISMPSTTSILWHSARLETKSKTGNKYFIPQIEARKVYKMIKSLDVNKATGLDNISTKILKIASSADDVCGHIAKLCNLSIGKSKFPWQWKQAKITPLFTNGSRENVANY